MNLKEAFRYQNKLQSFLDDAQSILDRDSNVTRVENTYLRHKVMAEAEDETVLAVPETEYYEQITGIARFLLYLLDEKGKLFAAIRKAKKAIRKAFECSMNGKGSSLVEIVSTCNSGWKMSPDAANKWMEEHMFPFYPIGDLKDTIPTDDNKTMK